MKRFVVSAFSCRSRFQVKLICCIFWGQYKVLVVYLNLLLWPCNSLWNNYSPANNHLCNHLLDLLQFFNTIICFQIAFYWLIEKALPINHNIIIFCLHSWRKISLVTFYVFLQVYLFLKSLDQLNNLNIDLLFLSILLMDICSIQLFFEKPFFYYFVLIKIQLKHKFLYQILRMLHFDLIQRQSL